MKRSLLISVLFIISLQLFAQRDFKPGYIITNSGDTLYGQIDYQIEKYNSENCYFKKDTNSEPLTYKPDQIKAYRIIDGKLYVSRKVTIEGKDKEVFLEFLVDGKLDVFYLPPDLYFIEKEDKGIHILENTEKIVYRKDPSPGTFQNDRNSIIFERERSYFKEGKEYVAILNIYMEDCPEIWEKISNSRLEQKTLIKLATEYHYNVCPDKECIVYSKSPPKGVFRMGYVIGCNLNNVLIVEDATEESWNKWAPGFMTGLQANIGNLGSYERLFVSLSFYYSQVKNYYLLRNYDYSKLELEILSRNILISTSFNYIYPRYKLKPFCGLGILYFKTLKTSQNLSESMSYIPEKRSVGPLFCTGLIADVTQRFSIKFETNYQYGLFNTSNDKYFSATTNNLNFLLTFQYQISKK